MIKKIKICHQKSKPELQKQFLMLTSEKGSEYFGITYYKTYPRFKKIPLKVNKIKADLEEIQLKRKSCREFDANKKIKFEDISNILFFSNGLKSKKISKKSFMNGELKRTHESAGASYPIEAYLVVKNVEDLKEGIYHYNILENSLEFKWPIKAKTFFLNIVPPTMEWVEDAGVAIILTAITARQEVKYGATSYRFIMKEAGAITHSIYLHSTKLKLGVCEIGAWDESIINKKLDLDTEEEMVVSLLYLGIPELLTTSRVSKLKEQDNHTNVVKKK